MQTQNPRLTDAAAHFRSAAGLVGMAYGVGVTVILATTEGETEIVKALPPGSCARPAEEGVVYRTRLSDYQKSEQLREQAAQGTERILEAMESAAGELIDDIARIEDTLDKRLRKKPMKRWQKNLLEMAEAMVPELIEMGMERRTARRLAVRQVLALCRVYSGQRMPSIREAWIFVRDLKICEEFTGTNYLELADRYGFAGERQVRNIVDANRRRGDRVLADLAVEEN